ncbi:papain-like cysteine protease family protein [Amycolatopsis samaneae]|uniref:Papain-like cysteine protease family protein n=1 Tax=Amycolatopsis samaneae TaxID=664691 RepID=A0ABW5GLJ3_9PSEU
MPSTSAPPRGARRSTASRLRRAAVFAAGALAVGVLTPATVASAAPAGPTASKQLNISQQVQEQDQWCWAGSGLTIAQYLQKDQGYSQTDFCSVARGGQPGEYCPNEAGYLEWVQTAFQALGINGGRIGGALSFAQVQQSIDGNSPIETGIYWTAGGGHAQVIYGYDSSTQALSYGDPWPSSPRYSQMRHQSYRSNGQFRWAESLYGEK